MGIQIPNFFQIADVHVSKIQTSRQFCSWARIERFVLQYHLQCMSCNLVRAKTPQWFGPPKRAALLPQRVPSVPTPVPARPHRGLSPRAGLAPKIQTRACGFAEV